MAARKLETWVTESLESWEMEAAGDVENYQLIDWSLGPDRKSS